MRYFGNCIDCMTDQRKTFTVDLGPLDIEELEFQKSNCLLLYVATTFFQIILTVAEHHSAIVPWQIVAKKTGANLKFVTLGSDEIPDVGMLKEWISERTKLIVVHHVSNVLGK